MICRVNEMYHYLDNPNLPNVLCGPVLIDELGLPRYWATVWATQFCGSLEPSTLARKLRHVESFYVHADGINGAGSIDDMLCRLDVHGLWQALESFFIHIRNRPITGTSGERWHSVLDFVRNVLLYRSKGGDINQSFQDLSRQFKFLEMLYNQLQVGKMRRPSVIRSLPANVLEALFELLSPDSSTNPFRNEKSRWRAYVIFKILLTQGLRRGELLLLPSDAVKNSIDKRSGFHRYWMNVTENPYEAIDYRSSKPSTKNDQSYRQIPVNESMSIVIQTYVENYRGTPDHSFLINSQFNMPMSHEALTKLFVKISSNLPTSAITELRNRTGKESVKPHDLRHTCAVVILNKLLESGDTMDEALAKMRAFFGWSETSDMPLRYARAVFEDRLSHVWSQIFDIQVDILRAIPGEL
jgi:integrase